MTIQIRNPRRALLAVAPLLLLLAGCGSLIGPSGAPPKIYALNPTLTPVDAPKVTWQLSVMRPDAPDVYGNQRIVIQRGGIIDYYADAQWPDETEPLLQRLIVEGFEKSGDIAAVGGERSGLHADVLLQLEVRNFVARYDSESGAPIVDVEIIAKLVTPDQRLVAATLDSHHTVTASENSIPAAVAAFDTATGQAISEIIAWTLKNGTAADVKNDALPRTVPHHRRRHR
jgi:cholesterol transport system auxiliary component